MVFNNELIDNILDAVFPLPENFGIILYANNYEEDELLQDIHLLRTHLHIKLFQNFLVKGK